MRQRVGIVHGFFPAAAEGEAASAVDGEAGAELSAAAEDVDGDTGGEEGFLPGALGNALTGTAMRGEVLSSPAGHEFKARDQLGAIRDRSGAASVMESKEAEDRDI